MDQPALQQYLQQLIARQQQSSGQQVIPVLGQPPQFQQPSTQPSGMSQLNDISQSSISQGDRPKQDSPLSGLMGLFSSFFGG